MGLGFRGVCVVDCCSCYVVVGCRFGLGGFSGFLVVLDLVS